MKCPRKGCLNEAEFSKTYGVLPCSACQASDHLGRHTRPYEFASLQRSHRVQAQRDKHSGDLLQPYVRGKANSEYFKVYPEQVETYGVEDELKKI